MEVEPEVEQENVQQVKYVPVIIETGRSVIINAVKVSSIYSTYVIGV